MHAEMHETAWLDARGTVAAAELARMCRMSVAEVDELVDYGLLPASAGRPGAWEFSAACVPPLRRACALRAHFDLDLFVLGLLYAQFDQIGRLEQQVRTLEAHVPAGHPPREGPEPWHEPHG